MDHNDTQHGDAAVDSVTRQQNGQFIDEGGQTFTPNLEETALAGEGDAQLLDADSSSVHALQVNMERSGADYIQTQKSFLTNSGAREIHSDTAKLTDSGVLNLRADSVDMKNSQAIITRAKDVTLSDSKMYMSHVDSLKAASDATIGVVTANEVEAQGDIKSFVLLSGNVRAGGSVTSTFTTATASAAGAAFAVVLLAFSRLLRRKS